MNEQTISPATLDVVRCVRCEQIVPWKLMDRQCLCAPDGGPHEGIAPVGRRQSGWSLHTGNCPRAALWAIGTELADGACSCRKAALLEPSPGHAVVIMKSEQIIPEVGQRVRLASWLPGIWLDVEWVEDRVVDGYYNPRNEFMAVCGVLSTTNRRTSIRSDPDNPWALLDPGAEP